MKIRALLILVKLRMRYCIISLSKKLYLSTAALAMKTPKKCSAFERKGFVRIILELIIGKKPQKTLNYDHCYIFTPKFFMTLKILNSY